MDSEKDVFLDTDQIAQRWRVDRATVRRAIESGRLPAANFGLGTKRARWRVRTTDLLEYEQKLTTKEKAC